MSLEVELSCGCEPCPIDLDGFGFNTEWEDPFFVGRQCCWHKQIKGTKGCVSPDIQNGQPAIYVNLDFDWFYISKKKENEWASCPEVLAMKPSEDGKIIRVKLRSVAFTVSASELRRWAKRIGAKRK
jgi:hypothetical protein